MTLSFFAGDKGEFFLFLKDKNGNPLDLSNVSTIKYAWKTDPKETSNVILKSGDGSGVPVTIIGDPTEGKIKVDLEPADTNQTPSCYANAAQILDQDSKPLTVTFDDENLPVKVLPKQF